jgi:hypothetical protein
MIFLLKEENSIGNRDSGPVTSRQGGIIEEKIGQLIDFYRQLVEKFTPKFSTPRGFQANVVHR